MAALLPRSCVFFLLTLSLSAQAVVGPTAIDSGPTYERASLPSNSRSSLEADVALPERMQEDMMKQMLNLDGVVDPGGDARARFTPPKGAIYKGGPVMVDKINLYVLWYGNWSNEAETQNIIRQFLLSIGNRNTMVGLTVREWFNINLHYYDIKNDYVKGDVSLAKEGYSSTAPPLISVDDFGDIVDTALSNSTLPEDVNGIYLVYAAPDITIMTYDSYLEFESPYCGCGSRGFIQNGGIKYAMVFNNLNFCESQCNVRIPSINKNPTADNMVEISAWAIASTATDPLFNGWSTPATCHLRYGSAVSVHQGAEYNVIGKNRTKFLIGEKLDITKGTCEIQGSSTVNRTNVGTYFKMYGRTFTGLPKDTHEAPLPYIGCYTFTFSPVKFFTIRWNVNDGKPKHVGCRNIILWTDTDCSGLNTTYDLPGGKWDPLKFSYPNTFINLTSILPTLVQSASCVGI